MKTLILSLLLALPLPALALEIAPYTPQALAQAQNAGKGVVLFFHADWCPTCRAQTKILRGWLGDDRVPGTVLLADYDTQKALERRLGVRTQSTMIFYQGNTETYRLSFVTTRDDLRKAFRHIH